MSYRFSQRERLRAEGDFRRLFQEGARVEGKWMVLYCAPSSHQKNRLGVSCERHAFRTQVLRNRAKRRLRECYRLCKDQLIPCFDLVLVAKKSIGQEPEFNQLIEEFQSLAKRQGILNE